LPPSPQINQFEQLMINYANEKMHQHYLQHFFKVGSIPAPDAHRMNPPSNAMKGYQKRDSLVAWLDASLDLFYNLASRLQMEHQEYESQGLEPTELTLPSASTK
jgi:hypothetical protein